MFRNHKKPNVLLTGASGFIGVPFLTFLNSKGFNVRVLTRSPKFFSRFAGVDVFVGDIHDKLDYDSLLCGVDVVVNLAAAISDLKNVYNTNYTSSKRLLYASVKHGIDRWVQLSSVGAYGPGMVGVVTEDSLDKPEGVYEKSKSDFDHVLWQVANSHQLDICVLRPSIVFGPYMRSHAIRKIIASMRFGLFTFIGPCGSSANYIHVDDVVEALYLCTCHPKAINQTYIVSGHSTIEDMIEALARGAGLAVPSRRIPISAARFFAIAMQWLPFWPLTLSRVEALSTRRIYSTQKIEAELGWRQSVSVKDGMERLAQEWSNER